MKSDATRWNDEWAALVAAEAALVGGREEDATSWLRSAVSRGAGAAELRSFCDQIELLTERGVIATPPTEILLLARTRMQAGDRALRVAGSVRSRPLIVHLSDLHFGFLSKAGIATNMHRFRDDENGERLSTHIVREIRHHWSNNPEMSPDNTILVVSGDITYGGTNDEFKLAASFLSEVTDQLSLDRQNVVFVPGNHDVNWSRAKVAQEERFDSFLQFARGFLGDTEFRRRYPLVSWNFDVAGVRPLPSEIVQFHTDRDDVVFVGLNSCVFENEHHHYGFVGKRQLDQVRSRLEDSCPPDAIRVAVVHHHLHPFPEALAAPDPSVLPDGLYVDQSTIRDAGLLEMRLEQLGFDLVLHGHKHQPQLRETKVSNASWDDTGTRPLIVLGAGSAGVAAVELEHGQGNHFSFLEILGYPRLPNADFLKVEWRELQVSLAAEWATTRTWRLEG